MEPSDQELAQRARRGEEGAFEALVDRHGNELFRLARALLGNAADAEDVVQDALLGAYRNIARFEGRSSPKTWLVRILTNHVSKFRRSRNVRRAVSLDDYGSAAGDSGLAGNGPGAAGVVAAPATASSPAAQVQHKVDIAAMLQSLSADHRQVIVLRELKQLSYEQIAETLGIPRGTVESRLHRARQELKQRFADYLQ